MVGDDRGMSFVPVRDLPGGLMARRRLPWCIRPDAVGQFSNTARSHDRGVVHGEEDRTRAVRPRPEAKHVRSRDHGRRSRRVDVTVGFSEACRQRSLQSCPITVHLVSEAGMGRRR